LGYLFVSQTQLDEETGVLFAVGKAAVGVCCQLLQEVGVVGHHEAHQHLVALTLHGGRAVEDVSLGVHLCHGAFCLVAVQLLFYAQLYQGVYASAHSGPSVCLQPLLCHDGKGTSAHKGGHGE
jgi:hypothetical protein